MNARRKRDGCEWTHIFTNLPSKLKRRWTYEKQNARTQSFYTYFRLILRWGCVKERCLLPASGANDEPPPKATADICILRMLIANIPLNNSFLNHQKRWLR